MSWKRYDSKTHNLPYWYNSETNESVWTKPDTKIDVSNNQWVEYMSKKHNLPFWYNPKTNKSVWTKPIDTVGIKVDATKTKETNVESIKKKVKVERKYKNSYENEPCTISVVSSNGMYANIRCASDSKYDQMEAIRDLNESMRDIYR